MSANSHWMSSPPPVYDASLSRPKYYTKLTPYLQLPHLLSLTWLAYPILSLLFIAFRLSLSSDSAQNAVANAKDDLLTSCKAAEQAATAAASMPRYLAVASNAQITDAVNGTMNAARATLVLALTIMEAIINFIVDIYRSTFLCFLELVVRGALSILIGAVQEFNNFLEGTLNSVRTGIQNDIASANSAIQSAVNAINKVNPFGDITVPQFSIPSLDGLQNVTLPSDVENSLLQLNASLPSISDLKDKVDQILDTPFELVKKDINDTFAGLSFDSSTLPVPEQNTVSFCGQMDTSVVDDLGRDLLKITKIGIVLLIVLALVLLALNCLLEWYKWRCLKRHLQYTREAWTTDPTLFHGGSKKAPNIDMSDHNLLMLQASSSHPLLTKIGNRITSLLRLSPSQHIHLQWFFHYVFHPPALACFLIGFLGLLSVELQLLAVQPLVHKYSVQAASSVNDFNTVIATSVNNSMYNQSAAYASDINGRVDHIQSTINDGLFGWVNGTTTTLNNTINEFYTDIQDAVTTVFNGTILESPVQEFIRCFIGSKVDAIEDALTFLHDNLVINIPRVNDTVLVLSPDDVNEATRPIAAAAIGGGNGDDQGLVGRLVAVYIESLKKERIMFGIFIGLWALVVLMALSVIFWHSYGSDWVEAYKKRRWQKKQRGSFVGIVPFRDFGPSNDHHTVAAFDSGDHDMEKKPQSSVDLPSFTPMPSPKPGLFNNLRTPVFNNRSLAPPPQHPLTDAHNSAFQKSWDSLMDQANPMAGPGVTSPESSKRSFKMRSPKALQNIGNKSRSASDSSSASQDSTESTEQNARLHPVSWLNRFTGAFWKKQQPQPDDQQPELLTPLPETETSERSRPPLTIAPVEETEGPAQTSHWSVSPGPPSKLQWVQSIVPTTTLSSLKPKSRRTASVPSDIEPFGPFRDSFAVAPAPRQQEPQSSQNQFAVPLHYGYEEPSRYPQISSIRHTRYPSQAAVQDPFVTPFDDENRVLTSPVERSYHGPKTTTTVSSPRKSTASSNPFVAMAI
ncbi:Plasma membrane fusion protein PRM1 [Abortiporus biennis]